MEEVLELRENNHLEVRIDIPNARVVGLTPMGYDEEIGLWEELEHRFRVRTELIDNLYISQPH